MKLTRVLTLSALATAIMSPAIAEDATISTPAQKQQIEQIVHNYLVTHPEVLIEASTELQKRQQQDIQKQAQSAISKYAGLLFEQQLAVTGNLKGNVTLVEFFDYQCIHCKKMAPVIDGLIKKDSNLRVIYKEFPIFGDSSELASRVALAAAMQGKYQQMHDALLNISQRLNEKLILNAAKSVGLDMVKLKKDMTSKPVSDALNANRQLAEAMHLMGTPAFVVASTPSGQFKAGSEPVFIPGAATEQALQDLIKKMA